MDELSVQASRDLIPGSDAERLTQFLNAWREAGEPIS
jgi:hypothetical protein